MRTVLAALLALAPGAAFAASSTLRKPLSARASGLAEAYGPVPGGLSSLGTNPAGVAAAKRPQLETAFASGVADDTFGFVGWAQPISKAKGVAAAGVSYYDGGKVEIAQATGARETITAARDLVGHLAWAMPLPYGLSAGATAKLYRFELAQAARANGFAGDAGAQWRTPLKGLTLGAALQNFGPGVKFEQDRDPLPTTYRGGASWQWSGQPPGSEAGELIATAMRFLLTAEAFKTRDEDVMGAAAAEVAMDFGTTSVALRGGWRVNSATDGPIFGAGFREGRFQVDYAMGDKRALGQVHNASFGVRF